MRRECRYVALTAAVAMLCGTAAAQDQPSEQTERPDESGAWADSLAYDEYLAGQDLSAAKLIGARVQNQQGEDLGRVEDLIVSKDDDVIQAVIAVGGVLGVGEKRVAVPYDELRVSRDGETLFLAQTREQLESLPPFEPEQRAGGGAEGAAAQRQAAAQQLAEQQEEQPAPAAAPGQPQPEQQTPQQQAAQREAEQPGAAAESAERPQPSQEVTVMDRSDRRASELIGLSVVDSRGETIGEIDDLVVSPEDGRIYAVLAIGGVIGIGERLVSVPLEDLELAPPDLEQREPGAAAEADENAARINMTSEELIETQPEFQYSADERTARTG